MAEIKLGNFDPAVKDFIPNFIEAIQTNLDKEATDAKIRDDDASVPRKVEAFRDADLMAIPEIQEALADSGFMSGGLEKGFYGYRTRAAVRLFQEYIRAYEGIPLSESLPNGIYSEHTDKHLRRWKNEGKKASWLVTESGKDGLVTRWEADHRQHSIANLVGTEYIKWLLFLEEIKKHYQENPNKTAELVNAFEGESDTMNVDDWDFGLDHMHMIGIRRNREMGKNRGSDDVIMLLLKGMVFKFQGSTDPGKTKRTDGPPYLVHGQHNYKIGLHQGSYIALRPQKHGVLVIRAKDFKLTDAAINNGLDPEPNGTINIHWGGRGGQDKIGSDSHPWSEGCQVITGVGYIDHTGKPQDCSSYRAATPDQPFENPRLTRGAYNVLGDLVTALSGGMAFQGDSRDTRDITVKYMLLDEEDLKLDIKFSAFATETIQNAIGFSRNMK